MQVCPRLMHLAHTSRLAAMSRSAVLSTKTGHFPIKRMMINLKTLSLTSQLQGDRSQELVGGLSDLLADWSAASEEDVIKLLPQQIYRGVHTALHHVETILPIQ